MDKKIRRNKIRRVRQVRRVKKILLSGVLVMAALLLVFLVFVPKVSAKRESKAQAAREIELGDHPPGGDTASATRGRVNIRLVA